MQVSSGKFDNADAALDEAIASLCVGPIRIGWRRITAGDEDALLPEEREFFARTRPDLRRASATARIVARALMHQTGVRTAAIIKAPSGAPIWPPDIKGSLAHDDEIAVAAVTSDARIQAVGVDVEPALPLPSELRDVVATRRERLIYSETVLSSRKLFVAKEAVYKAAYAIGSGFLDFADIEIDLAREAADVKGHRHIGVKLAEANHIVALAWINADEIY